MNLEDIDIDNLSIVAEPGGIQGSYTAGALRGLWKSGVKNVDFATASSSSIPSIMYYSSGEIINGCRMLLNEVRKDRPWDLVGKVHRVIDTVRNLSNDESYFEVDRLVDSVFREKYPIKPEKIRESESTPIVPLTDAETGEIDYLTDEDLAEFYDENQFFDLLRATMAEPFTYRDTVKIDEKDYFDSAFGNPLPVDAPQIEDSFKIVLRTTALTDSYEEGEGNLLESIYERGKKQVFDYIADILSIGRPEGFKKGFEQAFDLYREKEEKLEKMEEEGEALVVRNPRPISRVKDDERQVEKNIRDGEMAVMQHPGLQPLMDALERSYKSDFYLEE